MIDETASSDRTTTRQQLSVLYDPETGQAVHGHTFVGVDDELSSPDGGRARERIMREEVRSHPDVLRLRYAEAPPALRVEAPASLHVADDVVTARPIRLARRGIGPDVIRRLPKG